MTKIQTSSGAMFDFADPQPDSINIVDIANALSKIPRFAGQLRVNWSVLHHSVCCALEAERRGYSGEIVKSCLMHDFAEAYLGDVPTPLKAMLPDFRKIEAAVEQAIWGKFDFIPFGYKEIDREMFKCEAYSFFPDKGKTFLPPNVDTRYLYSPTVRYYLSRTASGESVSLGIDTYFWKFAKDFGLLKRPIPLEHQPGNNTK